MGKWFSGGKQKRAACIICGKPGAITRH